MSLTPGIRLGPYEIQSAIGAGGMGEVYKARDTRLDRIVAIKVLPAQFAADPQLRERFEREARAVAALNHPHICTLHDVGRQDGIDYLVMEYLEGQTLAQRLEKSALPLDQALQYAIQIADALDKAHRQGITHRDLKPANIMLTKSGVKLLDFGLAKLAPAAPVGIAGVTAAATQSAPLTGHGTILGTLQYMAPEQLEGKEADARTDVFAFGAMLYEMLTGRKAFEGKTQASLIGAIMHADPAPLSDLVPLAPPLVDRIVRKCLAKDRDDRWQSARDLLEAVSWITEVGAQTAVSGPAPVHRRSAERLWMLATAALLIVALLAVADALYVRRAAPAPLITRLDVVTPPSTDPFSFALSPDGRQLAFVATAEGIQRLWVRSLDQVSPRPFAGTDGAQYPFWAPDGRAIGFFAEGKLKRIDVAGGGSQVLADAPTSRGGTWNREGTILFTPTTTSGLMRVAATGGPATPVTRVAAGQASHRWAAFLPTQIVFQSARNGNFDLFNKPADGSAEERPLLVTPLGKAPQDWSSDGRFLLYATQDPKTASDLWALPLSVLCRCRRPVPAQRHRGRSGRVADRHRAELGRGAEALKSAAALAEAMSNGQ